MCTVPGVNQVIHAHLCQRMQDPTIVFAVQVEAMAQELTRYNFQRLVVSPFQRCIRTAQLLNTVLQLPYSSWQIDPAVCEVGVGLYRVQ